MELEVMTRSQLERANYEFLGRLYLHHPGQLKIVPHVKDYDVIPETWINNDRPKITVHSGGQREFPTRAEIIAQVAWFYRLKPVEIKSIRKHASIVYARWMAMGLCAELTPSSYAEIGQSLGGRDHTTIMHGITKLKELRARSPRVQDEWDVLMLRICNKESAAA